MTIPGLPPAEYVLNEGDKRLGDGVRLVVSDMVTALLLKYAIELEEALGAFQLTLAEYEAQQRRTAAEHTALASQVEALGTRVMQLENALIMRRRTNGKRKAQNAE